MQHAAPDAVGGDVAVRSHLRLRSGHGDRRSPRQRTEGGDGAATMTAAAGDDDTKGTGSHLVGTLLMAVAVTELCGPATPGRSPAERGQTDAVECHATGSRVALTGVIRPTVRGTEKYTGSVIGRARRARSATARQGVAAGGMAHPVTDLRGGQIGHAKVVCGIGHLTDAGEIGIGTIALTRHGVIHLIGRTAGHATADTGAPVGVGRLRTLS
jgi:hypothetical protein